jgi:hypothetical protein
MKAHGEAARRAPAKQRKRRSRSKQTPLLHDKICALRPGAPANSNACSRPELFSLRPACSCAGGGGLVRPSQELRPLAAGLPPPLPRWPSAFPGASEAPDGRRPSVPRRLTRRYSQHGEAGAGARGEEGDQGGRRPRALFGARTLYSAALEPSRRQRAGPPGGVGVTPR